jgi:hypothetical protein
MYRGKETYSLNKNASRATTTQTPATPAPPAKYLGPSSDGYMYGPYTFAVLPAPTLAARTCDNGNE